MGARLSRGSKSPRFQPSPRLLPCGVSVHSRASPGGAGARTSGPSSEGRWWEQSLGRKDAGAGITKALKSQDFPCHLVEKVKTRLLLAMVGLGVVSGGALRWGSWQGFRGDAV